jgi:molybdopterin synthase sulfur carrier subunit
MPRIEFTPNIQRHVACPPMTVVGTTVGEVLAAAFADNPRARAYVLDDQGALRKHMIIFVNGVAIADRTTLRDAVGEDAVVYVFQSLSGG